MHVTRLAQAPAYEAPNHVDMRCLRLQGKEAGPSTQMWMGMSQILPGRRDEQVLGPYDSCRFAPGEKRQLVNRSARPVLVALVMANAPPPSV